MRALGIDLGTRRIGVAVSSGTLATPYEVLERSGDRARDHQRIAELVEETGAEMVVVGLPRSLDGTLGPAARTAQSEIAQLRRGLGVAVTTYDERLTTVIADHQLMSQNVNATNRRRIIDKVAASVILQAWIDAGCPLDTSDEGA